MAVRPEAANGYHNLGVAYILTKQWLRAIEAFTKCLGINPAHRAALITLPLALLESGDIEGGLAACDTALALEPNSSLVHRTRGSLFASQNRIEQATAEFLHCLELEPDNPANIEVAAGFFFKADEASLAMEQFQKLCEHRAEPDTLASLASSAMQAGNLDLAIASLRKKLEIVPEDAQAHSVLLYNLINDADCSGEKLRTEHRLWRAHAPASRQAVDFSNTPDAQRRLRVGVLTPEFSAGSGSYFLPPIFRHHDPRQIELHAYYSGSPDLQTELYRQMFSYWSAIADTGDERLVEIIRADKIDILLDVSGHMPHHRLGVFARRAAPVQISYARYPATTGIPEMDYRLTDEWTDPTGETEHHYTENLIRLPGGYLAYEPPASAPDVTTLPAHAVGHITYGFFQTPLRLNASVLDVLAQTLARIPAAHLLIHYHVPDFDRPERWARRRIEEAMEIRGVDPARLQFRGPLTHEEHLFLINGVDIALDAFPYTGQTNTCECLWCGVPVVTLAGQRFSNRVSPAILQRVGLGDWVAQTPGEYVEIAAHKASDLESLAQLRRSLRGRIRVSGLLDGRRLTREIEDAFRKAWSEWCRSR